MRTADGKAVMCMRVESDKLVESGGWFHQLDEPLPPAPAPKPVKKQRDWTAECRRMYKHAKAGKKRNIVALRLDVSVKSLELLRVGIGWDTWNHKVFSSWPSRDDTGLCIGYIRRYIDGTKRTNKGGGTGLFYTANWYRHPGPVYIVEGGSDVAACETHKLCAIGRSSNVHGGMWIRQMIRRHAKHKHIFVIGERDEKTARRGGVASCPANCKGCAWCWPGKFGMIKVAGELGAVAVMIPEPYKDMRNLLAKGAINEFLSFAYATKRHG